jgi:hypothetical protein
MARRSKKRWSELSQQQRSAIVMAGAVQVGLQVAALVDLRRRPPDGVRGRKSIWAALSFVNFLGPIAYFAYGRRR